MSPRIRVLGIDASIAAAGFALPNGTSHTIRTTTKDGDHCHRIRTIRNHLTRQIITGLDLVVLEDLAFSRSSQATTVLAGLHYTLRLTLEAHNLPYAIVGIGQLKKYATGSGNADKTAMVIAARERLGYTGQDDNQADALWLQAIGHARYGPAACSMPQTNRAAIGKIDWPKVTR